MPTPAAQFSPELPWAAGTRGTITLRETVSKADLLNGALTFINGNGQLFQPEDNDGYVDYNDENGSPVISIAINDDETKNVLNVSVAQDTDVQRVIVGPAIGSVEASDCYNENLQELAVGESGFVFLVGYKGDDAQLALVTQDGRTAVTCKRIEDVNENRWFELINRQTPVTVNSLLKLPSAIPEGDLAALPKVLCEIYSDNNDAVIKGLHAPAEDTVEGAFSIKLFNNPLEQTEWGEQVSTLIIA